MDPMLYLVDTVPTIISADGLHTCAAGLMQLTLRFDLVSATGSLLVVFVVIIRSSSSSPPLQPRRASWHEVG